jgi:hypothetical protein
MASTTPVFVTISYSALAAAANASVNTGSGVTAAFASLANAHDFGDMDDDIKTFMYNPANAQFIRGAVKDLNYVIPTSNDDIDVLKFKQIYWGAYYLSKFPVPSGILTDECSVIGQTLIQLAAEKANLKQSDLDQLFVVNSEADLQQKMQAVSDLTTKFNGLYGSKNCTAEQSGGSNDVLKYALIGVAIVFVVVIGAKILKRK